MDSINFSDIFKNNFLDKFTNSISLSEVVITLGIALAFSFVIYFVANLYINYGQFRVFVVAVFIIACLLQRVLSNQVLKFFMMIVAKTKKNHRL